MKRTIALAAALAGAVALTASTTAHAQHQPQWQQHGFQFGMHQGRLGAQVTTMTSQLRRYFGAPAQYGLLVSKVLPGTPADKAGVKAGDVITKVDGRQVVQPWDVMTALAQKKKGDRVTIEVVRNQKIKTLRATMQSNGWNIPNMAGMGKAFGSFGRHFNKTWGPNWSKQFGKDFDIIIKDLQNGHINLGKIQKWGQTNKNDLSKKLKETMQRVLELEKQLKKMKVK